MDLNPIGMPRQAAAMQKRFLLAVLSHDHKFAKRIVEEARRRRLEVVHVHSRGDIPLTAKAVIMKRGEFPGLTVDKAVEADSTQSAASVVDKAIEKAFMIDKVAKALVAVDPGKKTGLAYYADNVLLRTETLYDYEVLAEHVADFFRNHPESVHHVVMGAGASVYREQLTKSLLSKMPELSEENIFTVPEGNSTRLAKGRDELAAAVIHRLWSRGGKRS
ncbi:MAG: hypothetical protein NYU05_02835 [Aigarchaeota archaeon]|nr:hypothetical protein [Candidatus Caldarchaeales archaeon]